MEGDILILNKNHLKAGKQVTDIIFPDIKKKPGKYLITVAGESGAGKSEVAEAIARSLKEHNISSFIFAQDDYFILPPYSNAEKRKEDINWVGIKEVKIDLLNQQINDIINGNFNITKPLVLFNENKISSETVNLKNYKVIIFEGTYTTVLEHIDTKVFIDRNYHDTKASRLKRNREKQDSFLEQILEIEHKIISSHKSMANLIANKNYEIKAGSTHEK